MDGKNEALLLVEFDSMKGPLIRIVRPKKAPLIRKINEKKLLIWIIRASEFSVQRLGELTVYAKALSLDDPNFSRKKRQFGVAFLTQRTLELTVAQKLLELLTQKCKKEANNQGYFLMLKKFLEILEYAQVQLDANTLETEPEEKEFDSNKLQVFNKLTLNIKELDKEIIVNAATAPDREEKENRTLRQFENRKIKAEAMLQGEPPQDLDLAMDLFLRILERLPKEELQTRIVAAVEYLDRLLFEKVDIEYFLSFLQYFISMEEFTISEFKKEELNAQLKNLQETHGEWIKCLVTAEFTGKSLEHFFEVTGYRREGLELLIDLLFIKIIAVH
ncbi:MAG: hypothetical protein K9W42_01190 [Candidatus Heimdallarchaeota archaeon]|nr:hypothetical protein [Candidatus Heimdallarchaeota archaeon]